MKGMIKIGSRLAIICAVAAVVLAMVNAITAPEIAAYKEKVVKEALEEVSNGYEIGELKESSDDSVAYYHELKENGEVTGYVMNISANGYGGPMRMLASFSISGEILSAKLIEDAETPGLGKKAEDAAYMVKFLGTGAERPVPLKKSSLSSADSDAVSGASITFNGIAKALYAGSQYAQELGGVR